MRVCVGESVCECKSVSVLSGRVLVCELECV